MNALKGFTAIVALAAAWAVFIPSQAFAYRVYSPTVVPDETAVGFWGDATGESNTGGTKKAEAKRGQVELRHTFFDRLDLGLFLVAESGANGAGAGEGAESIGYSRTKVKALYQVTAKGGHFADVGVYVDYQKFRDSLPNDDYLNIMVLFEKDLGHFVLTLNPGIRKAMTKDMEIAETATYQAGLKYLFDPLFNPGIQAQGISLGPWGRFDSPDKQQQNAGPAFYGELKDVFGYTVAYEGALLFGLTTGSHNLIASGVVEIKF